MIMTEQERLAAAIDEVHLDQLRHPDPCADCLIQLLQAVERHAREETAAIDAYARIGRDIPDPAVKAVMQLLVEDERHHHQLFEQLAASLREQLNWTASSAEHATQADSESATAVRALAEDERRGARALRELSNRRNPAARSGLVYQLLQTMAMDSDKHARLLDFVATRLSPRR